MEQSWVTEWRWTSSDRLEFPCSWGRLFCCLTGLFHPLLQLGTHTVYDVLRVPPQFLEYKVDGLLMQHVGEEELERHSIRIVDMAEFARLNQQPLD